MEKITQLLSEFYYDILGRIVPGVVGTILFLKILRYNLKDLINSLFGDISTLTDSQFVLICTVIIIAYIVGHLISPISSMLHSRLFSVIFSRHYNVLFNSISGHKNSYPSEMNSFLQNEVTILFEGSLPKEKTPYRRTVYLWFDWIKLHNKQLGDKLVKMRAEYRMLEGLNAVFFISIILYLLVSIKYDFRIDILGLLTFLFAFVAYTGARSFRTYQFAIINSYHLLKKNESKTTPNNVYTK
ncbi:MAG: hypothetical protein AB7S48_09615 [Bacteroidales bacterium]